tara:strand:+ start:12032 stop:13780 length:1749 start_codon:yes stop_codon:yes gene_type:complete
MSQRKVGLKVSDYSNIVQNVNVATQNTTNLLSRVAKIQAKDRADSERAIQIGTQTTEALIKEFGNQLVPLEANMDAALKEAIREQAVIIGEAKAKASKPGATKADRDALARAQTNGRSNLRTLGTWVVNSAAEQNIYALHQQSVATGSTVNRLDNEALLDNDKVNFSARMASGLADSVKISMKTGSPVITAGYYASEADREAGTITNLTARDLGADIKAFNLTGTNLASHVITADESLTTSKGFKPYDDMLSKFTDVTKETITLRSDYDASTRTKSTLKVAEKNDVYTKMMNNHSDVLLAETRLNFGKKWDQLNMLKMLSPDSKFKGINWSTFNNENAKAGAEALNKSGKKDLDPLEDGNQAEITEKRYLELQGEMRKEGADGIARLMDMYRGTKTETVLNDQEIQNYYKDTSGKFTDAGKATLKKNFINNYAKAYPNATAAYPEGIVTYNAEGKVVGGIYKVIIDNPDEYGADGKKVMTGKEMQNTFPGTDFGSSFNEDVLYKFSTNNPQGFEIVAKPNYFTFTEGNAGQLDADGRNYMFNIMGVDDYQQAVFNSPNRETELGPLEAGYKYGDYPIMQTKL